MKKTFTHMVLVTAVMVSGGCTSNFVYEIDQPRELHFNVTLNPYTKGAEALVHPADIPFGVWSFDQDGTACLNDEKVNYKEEGKWVPEKQKMWSEDAEEMNFIAYSPYGKAGYDEDYGIRFLTYDIDEGIDLLYSEPLLRQKKDGSQSVIQISMMRALSVLRLKVRTVVPEYTEIVVRRVDVKGIRAVGDFQSLPEPYWTNLSSLRDFCFHDGDIEVGGEPKQVGDCMYVIPQMSDVSVDILCDIKTGDVILRDQVLIGNFMMQCRPGKISSYMIKIDGSLNVTVEKDNE